MKKTVALIMTLIMVLALAACGPAGGANNANNAADAEPAYPIEQLTIGTTADIEKAVPDEYNYEMLSSGVTHMPLVYQDTEGAFHPLLASFETKDAATWTFTIVDGMKWSDGVDVTAEDILFTLQREDANGKTNFTAQTDKDGRQSPQSTAATSFRTTRRASR